MIDKIDTVALDSADNGGLFETGFSGSILRDVPGTAAKDLAANIQTIDANSAFTALQAMRDASPTGGALGQITERELDLLKSTIANLDPNQSQGQFLTNLTEAKRAYLDILARIDPSSADEINLKPGIRFDKEGRGFLTTVSGSDDREIQDPLGFDTQPPNGGGPSDGGTTLSQFGQGIAQGFGDIAEGIGDLVGIVNNPIAQTISDAAGFEGQVDTGRLFRETAGLPESPEGIGRTARQAAASALTGGLAARGVAALASPGVTQNVARIVGSSPIRDTAAGAGAGAGGQIGQDAGGPVGAVAGTLAGGVGGFGAANALARSAAPRAANALAGAAQRQGVDLLPAETGGAVARAVTTGTRASPLSVAPVVKQAKQSQEQFGKAVQRTATSEGGEVATTDVAGDIVRGAAEKFSKQTAQRGSRLYDRAAELGRSVRAIKPARTIAAIDEAIARLAQNPAADSGVASQLKAFRERIAGGASIQGLRDARTALSQGVYNGQLRSSSEQKMWKDILSSVADDIDTGLRSVGRDDAANAFRTADKFWKERVQHIDNVLQPILGRDGTKSGEDIIAAVESMARGKQGGAARLSRLLANMPESEAATVRAVIIDRIGRANPGAQDAAGEVFSASTFLTNWNKMTPQAKVSLFGDKQMRNDLNDLAVIAEGTKTGQSMTNFSNTGVAIGANVAGATALTLAHPGFAVAGAVAQLLTGTLMASPAFARLLARTAKMPPEASRRTLTQQLGILAAREPLIANDAQALSRALTGSSGNRLAAEEPNQ
ncbi:MAG: hypothetical protein NUV75_00675 [Gallionella sp.]|nr:hypothetical protein [Gallionella sp.]